jgi:hypothetical protein
VTTSSVPAFATYLPTQALEIVKRGRLVEIERVPVAVSVRRAANAERTFAEPNFAAVEERA